MVFGLKIFGGSSPPKDEVDADAPRKADRVEKMEAEKESVDDSARGDSIEIPDERAMDGDSLTTPRASTVSTGLTSVRTSAATIAPLPSVSSMIINSGDGIGESERQLVPLNSIPDFILNEHPELKLAVYDLGRGNICSNAIALPHNACRLEMSDFWSDVLPSLQSRPLDALTREETSDLSAWWAGFARFALTTSLVDDMVMARAFKDIIEDFDKEAQIIKRNMTKYEEKNTVTLEIVVRQMGKAVETFCEHATADHLQTLETAWVQLSMTLSDIYVLVEKTLTDIDMWRHAEIAEHKDLEKKIAGIYTNRKRWGNDDTKRGEMIIVLTRWVGSEQIMRTWMQRNLGKREFRCIDRWMDEYRGNRLQLVDRFHQRRAL